MGRNEQTMMRKVFVRLLGLFVLLLIMQTVGTYFLFHAFAPRTAGDALHGMGRDALLAGGMAMLLVLPMAAWFSAGISKRLNRVISFARHIAEGRFETRLELGVGDELLAMEEALNQAAGRLEQSFSEIENRRRELAVMLDSMQEAVVAVTSEGMVCWSNLLMQKIAGTQIREGRSLVHSLRDPDLLEAIAEVLMHGEVRFGRASSLAPGRIYEISAAPLPGGGALAVLHDVTRIETAEKSRRDFIANVSHELRTPLTSIQGYVETLIEEPRPDGETALEFLMVIQKNASRMNRLTEDLLALASVESPDYKVNSEPMRASELLQDAVETLEGIVGDSGMELESAGAPDVEVLADPDGMNQVFGNLIENALKYASKGKRIRLGAQLGDGEVEFMVHDYGPGIASEHIGRIFERFYRVDKARSRESGGTGLGLAISKHIVQAQGGRIWAESELGSGTTFHFTLPMADPESLTAAGDESVIGHS